MTDKIDLENGYEEIDFNGFDKEPSQEPNFDGDLDGMFNTPEEIKESQERKKRLEEKQKEFIAKKESIKNVVAIKSKPEFNIVINKETNVIQLIIDYNEDIIRLIKKEIGQARWIKESECYELLRTNLNMIRIDQFLKSCQRELGDLKSLFNFNVSIVEPVEVKEVVEYSFLDEMKSKGEFVEENYKEEVIVKEKVVSKKSSSKDLVEQNVKDGRFSITEQKKTFYETFEEATYNLVKDKVVYNNGNQSVYMYDEQEKMFINNGVEKGIKIPLIRIMRENGLSSYTSDADMTSVQKSIFNYVEVDNLKKNLRVNIFNVETEEGEILSMYFEKGEDGVGRFRVIEARRENFAILKVNIKISEKNIKDLNGNEWQMQDLNENKYYYDFKVNEESFFIKNYINKLFKSENHKKVAMMFFGSLLAGLKIAKMLFLLGHGGDGKSVLLEMFQDLYLSASTEFKLVAVKGGENFNYVKLLNNIVFSYISEVSDKSDFDEEMLKNLTGDKYVNIAVKGKSKRVLDTSNMQFVMGFNYTNMIRLKNVDRSIVRRICCVQCGQDENETDKKIILNLSDKMINGFTNPENGEFVKSQKLEMFHWVLQGAVDCVSENAFSENEMVAEKYGQDVFDFNNAMIAKLAGAGQFFEEEDFKFLSDGKITPKADLYKYYLQVMEENMEKHVMGSAAFNKSLVKHIFTKYKVNLDAVRIRCRIDSGKLVDGYPLSFSFDRKANDKTRYAINNNHIEVMNLKNETIKNIEKESKDIENKEVEQEQKKVVELLNGYEQDDEYSFNEEDELEEKNTQQ